MRMEVPTRRSNQGSLLSRPPLQIHNLPMGLVRRIHASQLKPHAVGLQRHAHPTGRLPLLEHISHRRQIYEVYAAAVGLHSPRVRVAVDVSFDLPARPDNVE